MTRLLVIALVGALPFLSACEPLDSGPAPAREVPLTCSDRQKTVVYTKSGSPVRVDPVLKGEPCPPPVTAYARPTAFSDPDCEPAAPGVTQSCRDEPPFTPENPTDPTDPTDPNNPDNSGEEEGSAAEAGGGNAGASASQGDEASAAEAGGGNAGASASQDDQASAAQAGGGTASSSASQGGETSTTPSGPTSPTAPTALTRP